MGTGRKVVYEDLFSNLIMNPSEVQKTIYHHKGE